LKRTKLKVGISFDPGVIEAIDRHVAASAELATHRSEVVNAIIAEFLDDGPSDILVKNIVRARRRGSTVQKRSGQRMGLAAQRAQTDETGAWAR
jgi:hypothetical protein